MDDPQNYSAPWSFVNNHAWRPDMEVFEEFDCETQASGPDAASSYGLKIEPEEKPPWR